MTQPKERFQCGACEVSTFENELKRDGQPIKIKKVAIQKRYKDDDGWKSHSAGLLEREFLKYLGAGNLLERKCIVWRAKSEGAVRAEVCPNWVGGCHSLIYSAAPRFK